MPKSSTKFVCRECGYETSKWLGKCPECEAWNSFDELMDPGDDVSSAGFSRAKPRVPAAEPVAITEVQARAEDRMSTSVRELDRVLGGGIVPGSLVLVGGDPGIGKSTLLLSAAKAIATSFGPVLYVSGEESLAQVKLRADRIDASANRLYLLSETDVEEIQGAIARLSPVMVVVDSIQTIAHPELKSAPGTVSQVRECAASLLRTAKTQGPAVFLVGHVTKAGAIAGPRVLEHIVDTVLYFEGERHNAYRILRAVKNRFGSTNEIGIFEMRDAGLFEVANPSQAFLSERPAGVAGSTVVPSLEGTRPVLVEIQALVASMALGIPRRVSTGVDSGRVAIILAVLDRRVGLHLGADDVYVSCAGGMRVDEPAADLGIAVAVASAFRGKPVGPRTAVFGEIGLLGEVRAVSKPEVRAAEAAKLGFRRCVMPEANVRHTAATLPGIGAEVELVGVKTVYEALEAALGGN